MNTYRTAKEVIERLRVEALKKYENKLQELRGMEIVLMDQCPHENRLTSNEVDFCFCADCGKAI